jgi:hypothetical protein
VALGSLDGAPASAAGRLSSITTDTRMFRCKRQIEKSSLALSIQPNPTTQGKDGQASRNRVTFLNGPIDFPKWRRHSGHCVTSRLPSTNPFQAWSEANYSRTQLWEGDGMARSTEDPKGREVPWLTGFGEKRISGPSSYLKRMSSPRTTYPGEGAIGLDLRLSPDIARTHVHTPKVPKPLVI